MITTNAPAEYGNSMGAIVNTSFKSGTNEFHGGVFEFLRNDKLDANSGLVAPLANRAHISRKTFSVASWAVLSSETSCTSLRIIRVGGEAKD